MSDFDPVGYLDDPSVSAPAPQAFDPIAHLDDPTAGAPEPPKVRPLMPDGRKLGETHKGVGDFDASTAARDTQILKGRGDTGPDSPFGVVAGKLFSGAESAGRRVAAGYRGLADLATGQGLGSAAADVNRVSQTHPYQVDPRSGNIAAVAGEAMDSPFNPLNWVPKGAQLLGKGATAGLQAAGAGPEVSQGIGQAIGEAGPWALGLAAPKGTGSALPEAAPGEFGQYAPPAETAGPAATPGVRAAPTTPGGAPVGQEPLAPMPKAVEQEVAGIAQIQHEAGTPLTAKQIDEATRVAEARSLDDPVELTKGMRTLDPNQISFEQNNREGQIAERVQQINSKLTNTLNKQHEKVTGESAQLDNEALSENLMGTYEAADKARNDAIAANYKAVSDANGGQFPIDLDALNTGITKGLKKALLTPESMSPTLRKALQMFDEDRPMSFEDFERLRTITATDMRAGGHEASAAGVVRSQLENLPLTPEAAQLKGLADTARASAKARFDAIENDPAYADVVNGKAKSTTFYKNRVLNAPREHLQAMRENVGSQPGFDETVGGIVTNHLREQARVGQGQTGNFASDSYNNAFRSLSRNGKLPILVRDQAVRDQLGLVGNVARYANARPVGHTVGPSTAGILADISPVAEVAANAATHGVAGTIVGGARMVTKPISKGFKVRSALEPWRPPTTPQ